jgi:hypothetical protein
MEAAVGANAQVRIFTGTEVLVGFLEPSIKSQIKCTQGGFVVGEPLKLGALKVLGPTSFPIGLRDQVFVEGAIFLRMEQIQRAGFDGVGDLNKEDCLVQ